MMYIHQCIRTDHLTYQKCYTGIISMCLTYNQAIALTKFLAKNNLISIAISPLVCYPVAGY